MSGRFGNSFFDLTGFIFQEAEKQDKIKRRAVSCDELRENSLSFFSPHVLRGDVHVENCVYDKNKLELKTVTDANSGRGKARGVYSCSECHMIYFMPVDTETQEQIDRSARGIIAR